jgi:hypothetical protein
MKTKFLHMVDADNSRGCDYVPGLVINRETARYKFGGDPMAEYLWELAMDGGQDDDTGEVDWVCWVVKFGKRLLFTDDRGFVWCDRYANEEEAQAAFDYAAGQYNKWLNQDEEMD